MEMGMKNLLLKIDKGGDASIQDQRPWMMSSNNKALSRASVEVILESDEWVWTSKHLQIYLIQKEGAEKGQWAGFFILFSFRLFLYQTFVNMVLLFVQ